MTGSAPKPPNFDRIIGRNRSRALPSSGSREPSRQRRCASSDGQGRHGGGRPHRGRVREAISPVPSMSGSTARQFANRVGLFAPGDRPLVLVAGGLDRSLPAPCRAWDASGLTRSPGICSGAWATGRARASRWSRCRRSACTTSRLMEGGAGGPAHRRRARAFEWDEGHIEGALHLPMGEAVRRLAEVPTGRPTAVVCAGGLRSSLVISARGPRGSGRALAQRGRRHGHVDACRLSHRRERRYPDSRMSDSRRLRLPHHVAGLDPGDKETVARQDPDGLALSMDPKELIFRGLIPGMDVVGRSSAATSTTCPRCSSPRARCTPGSTSSSLSSPPPRASEQDLGVIVIGTAQGTSTTSARTWWP